MPFFSKQIHCIKLLFLCSVLMLDLTVVNLFVDLELRWVSTDHSESHECFVEHVQCVIFQYRREVFDFINIHIRSCEFSIMTEMNKILRGRKDEKQSFFVIKLNVKMVWLINTVDYS
jgi:hypothetical protein